MRFLKSGTNTLANTFRRNKSAVTPVATVATAVSKMAERQRQRLRALRNDPTLVRFVVEGVTTGKQLGTGSYGTVEEVRLLRKLGVATSYSYRGHAIKVGLGLLAAHFINRRGRVL